MGHQLEELKRLQTSVAGSETSAAVHRAPDATVVAGPHLIPSKVPALPEDPSIQSACWSQWMPCDTAVTVPHCSHGLGDGATAPVLVRHSRASPR